MKFHFESLPEHGAHPLWSVSLRTRGNWGRGIRLSHGGYVTMRPQMFFYKNTGVHFWFLRFQFSILFGKY